jgi:hypothetical protein
VANVGSLVKLFPLTPKKSKRKEKFFDPCKKLHVHVHLHSWKISNDEKNSLTTPLDGPSRGRGGKRA